MSPRIFPGISGPSSSTEDPQPERAADQRQDDELAGAAARAFLAQPLQRGAPLGLQDMRE